MNKKILAVLAFALPLAFSSVVLAAPQGPYVGASFGHAKIKLDEDGSELDGLGTYSISLFGGFRFNRYFGAEIGYIRFDDVDSDTEDGTLKMKLDGFTAHVVGFLPISSTIDGFAKLGVIRWDGKESWRDDLGIERFDDDGTDLSLGAGFTAQVTPAFSLRGEWTYYQIEPTGYDADTSVVSIGGTFNF